MRPRFGTCSCLAVAVVAGLLPSCGRIGFELLDPTPSGGGAAGGRDASTRSDGGAPDASAGGASARDAGTGGTPDAVGGAEGGGGVPDASSRDGSRDGPAPDSSSEADGDATPSEGAAPVTDGAPSDARPLDAAGAACVGAKEWSLDFDSDPTTIEANGDGVLDWITRSGAPFPAAALQGGVWRSETQVVLDSRPMDDFATRTVVDVRMRSLSVPASGRGAVFWVNLNQGGPTFSALFVSLALEVDGGQTLTLFGKVGNVEVPLATFADLPEDFVSVHLDIDPAGLMVALSAGSAPLGSYAIPETGLPNADHFATVLAWEGIAELDSLRIQRCPP